MPYEFDRKVVLEDGSEFCGYGFGSPENKLLEIVFNTTMAGYQEIISDPSYTDQAVVMTYPLIGNYGMNDDDYETKRPSIGAMIVRDYNDHPSNFRSKESLDSVMKRWNIAGLSGVDTRKLARTIRDYGSCKAFITAADTPHEECMKAIEGFEFAHDQVSRVSTHHMRLIRSKTPKYLVAAIDCGMKENMVRDLNKCGCDVFVMPYNVTAAQIEEICPDGILISNGPGNPEDAVSVIETVRALRGKYPMFGICLGHQIISLAYGAKTYKLKFGHRGGNHPVKNLKTDKVEITSQNHSFAVDDKSLEGTGLVVTHINLLDNTVEGMECEKEHVFSVQYHPESAPGPQDSGYLFKQFTELMEEVRHNA